MIEENNPERIKEAEKNQKMRIIQQTIEYIIRLANISIWYYVVAVAIGIIIWLIWKKPKVAILVCYMLIVFSIAVLSRKTGIPRNNFELFKTYHSGITSQILANIIIFIPIEALLAIIDFKRFWIGPAFSVLIELSQLLFHRGWFDVDDMVSNCVGVLIGIMIVTTGRRISHLRSSIS